MTDARGAGGGSWLKAGDPFVSAAWRRGVALAEADVLLEIVPG
jgi:hypothetical protein